MSKFSSHLTLPIVAAVLALTSCKDDKDLPACDNIHWNYDDATEEGPEHWGELCVDYTDCAGKAQSPIDIKGATEDASLAALVETFAPSGTHILNNGHTLQFTADAGTSLTLNGEKFDLLQFHTHTSSEHTVNGASYPMEVHFVHKNASTGKLAVIGVLVKAGAENTFLKSLTGHLPAHEDETFDDAAATFSISDFLPANKSYFTYGGSLTTPPCSEIVTWLVLENPVEASQAQIDAFKSLEHTNNRPVLSLNNRALKHKTI